MEKAAAGAMSSVLAAVCAPAAQADDVVYRFEAVRTGLYGTPPPGSVTAQAADLTRITGSFGFSPDALRTSQAALPGRVRFATYATGFVHVDDVDIGRIPGPVLTQVTDGILWSEDPAASIGDALVISTAAQAPGESLDSLALRLRYEGTETLARVDLPASLDLGDVAEIGLTFGHRTDTVSERGEPPQTGADGPAAVVTFRILGIREAD